VETVHGGLRGNICLPHSLPWPGVRWGIAAVGEGAWAEVRRGDAAAVALARALEQDLGGRSS